ncbi:radical SAM protein [Sulfurospirillum diekertiae]|uniref:Radical SAM protein n=2 Tax=Sulfurospirillum diekertiae TaxID=1854492 RepID=A0A290HA41_9BACT|nr:TIGR01212 family radical SAM protein [Sulfurospirillum diekertiae]ATB68433.1 radical SAM protein [Sulfurospirillum diekertiae]
MLPYLSHKAHMQRVYGEALFSIPVNVEFGCPNRERDGSGGCSFCPEHGARAAQIADAKSVEEQIQKALSFAKRRYNAKAFALYIQAYTGTFASLIKQKETYEKLLAFYPFRALHVGTRPDCLSESTLSYLAELNQKIDVVVELGVQTLHDASLKRINRGHDAACSLEAIKRLHVKGLKVYAHLIIGLPYETPQMWKESVQGLVNAGIDGIKFHNLHIIQNTDLAREFSHTPFPLLSEYEYAEALIELLRYVPSHIPILRLATDTPERELIAPKWHMAKGQFGEYVAQTMRYRGIKQGNLVEKELEESDEIPQKINLEDGSTTLWNEIYHDYYHPKAGAIRQAQELFLAHSNLKERLEKSDVKLLEIGFGMGYNTFSAVQLAQTVAQNRLHVKAIDQDRMLLQKASVVISDTLHVKMLDALFTCKCYDDDFAKVEFLNAEARYVLRLLDEQFDVIFLDPFIESNNASLVTLEFFQHLRNLLKPDGVLVASTALQVSQVGLNLAGFDVMVIKDATSDIQGVVATLSSSHILHVKEPYRDIYGIYNDKQIETLHQKSSN